MHHHIVIPLKVFASHGEGGGWAGTNAKSMTYKIASKLYHTVCHNSQVININIRYAGSVLLLICTFLSYKPDNFPSCFFNIGRPRASRNSMCVYDEYLQLLNITVNVEDIIQSNSEETESAEVSYVRLAVSNAMDLEQLHIYSITPINKSDSLNGTFSYHTRLVDHTNTDEIGVYITVVDKCAQESLSEVINCTITTSKGNINNLYASYIIEMTIQCLLLYY